MNHSKCRRLSKAAKPKGPSGEPHPFGNREHRRSKEGKQQIELLFQKWAAQREMGLNQEKTVLHEHPMNEA